MIAKRLDILHNEGKSLEDVLYPFHPHGQERKSCPTSLCCSRGPSDEEIWEDYFALEGPVFLQFSPCIYVQHPSERVLVFKY